VARLHRRTTSVETSTISSQIPLAIIRTIHNSVPASNNQASAGGALPPSTIPVKVTEAPASLSQAHSMAGTNTESQDRVIKMSSVSSYFPESTAQGESSNRSNSNIQGKEAGSSASTTNARLNWQPSKSDDPFGVRVSTNEFASGYPFELANRAMHGNVRDNILYDTGYRDATAYFPHLPDQAIQPLQPCADRTPDSVKEHIAANSTLTEAAKAEIKAAKAGEFKAVGAQEVTTIRGIREEILSSGPTYYDTVRAAIVAAGEDPIAQVDGKAAFEFTKNEAITERRAAMKAEAMAMEFPPTETKDQEYTGQSSFTDQSFFRAQDPFIAQNFAYSTSDAPTEEELPGKNWALNIADRTINRAQMQYDMMYQVVTQS